MSKSSGKCDFYDGVVAIHCDGDTSKLEEFLARTTIRVRGADGRDHVVSVKNEKDASLYYPYLEAIAAFNNHEGRNSIVLSSQSFIDSEERERVGWYVRDVMSYWRKCKKEKKAFDVEECVQAKGFFWTDTTMLRKVAEKVAKDGNKAEFDDIHTNMHEHYRREWFEEMVRVGHSEWFAFNWAFNEFYPKEEVIELRLGRPLNKEG